MFVTLSGIVIFLRRLSIKAPAPIFITLSGMVTFVSRLLLKA